MAVRKVFGSLVVVFALASCSTDGQSAKEVVDSTVNKLEVGAEKVGEKAERIWDTTKVKARNVKEDLDEVFDGKGDSDR